MDYFLFLVSPVLLIGLLAAHWLSGGSLIRKMTVLGVMLSMSFALFYHINVHLSGSGFSEAVVFHLLNAQGDWLLLFTFPQVKDAIGLLTVFVGIYVFFLKKWKKRGSFSVLGGLPAAFILVWTTILLNPIWIDILNTADRMGMMPVGGKPSINLDKYQKEVVPKDGGVLKNTIIIYAESLERAFFDPVFGKGTAVLEGLGNSSYQFNNIRQLDSAGWTMAAMIATQCGVPFSHLGNLNKSAYRAFLKNNTCLGELAKNAGYRQRIYLGGASLSFSAKGDFYKESGFSTVMGREELAHKESVNEWGLFDEDLFHRAMKYVEVAKKEAPYLMVLLTLDTHPPYGFLSPKCLAQGGEPKSEQERHLRAIRCSSESIATFIARQQEEAKERGEDLRVILLSDHLMMSSPLNSTIKENDLPRRGFFWIWDSALGEGLSQREGSALDVAATISEVLFGADGVHGLGVSLLSKDKNLIEKYGFDAVNQSALSWRAGKDYGFFYEWLEEEKSKKSNVKSD